MRAAQISLILSTYERPGPLDQVLQGVRRQSETPAEILIADDGSGPATRALIGQWQSRLAVPLRHLWQPDLGFRKTLILNQSVAAAKGDYVVLLDGDCVPHRKFIADHAALAEKGFWVQGRRCFVREEFAAAFSAGATPVWRWILAGRITGLAKAVRLPFPVVRRNTGQRGIIGCNMGFWREDLLAINGFDEEYTGWGIGEDSDLGTRLYHLGRPRKFVYGHAVVYHLNHPMLGRNHIEASLRRLAETIRSGKIRCERGLDQYLPGNRVEASSPLPPPPQEGGGEGEEARGGEGPLKRPA
jgi:glycosyltransferase involved in cell wall biosynthesis